MKDSHWPTPVGSVQSPVVPPRAVPWARWHSAEPTGAAAIASRRVRAQSARLPHLLLLTGSRRRRRILRQLLLSSWQCSHHADAICARGPTTRVRKLYQPPRAKPVAGGEASTSSVVFHASGAWLEMLHLAIDRAAVGCSHDGCWPGSTRSIVSGPEVSLAARGRVLVERMLSHSTFLWHLLLVLQQAG